MDAGPVSGVGSTRLDRPLGSELEDGAFDSVGDQAIRLRGAQPLRGNRHAASAS
jgi:hypothetical protein